MISERNYYHCSKKGRPFVTAAPFTIPSIQSGLDLNFDAGFSRRPFSLLMLFSSELECRHQSLSEFDVVRDALSNPVSVHDTFFRKRLLLLVFPVGASAFQYFDYCDERTSLRRAAGHVELQDERRTFFLVGVWYTGLDADIHVRKQGSNPRGDLLGVIADGLCTLLPDIRESVVLNTEAEVPVRESNGAVVLVQSEFEVVLQLGQPRHPVALAMLPLLGAYKDPIAHVLGNHAEQL
jgi:hypothetical protein